MVSRQRDDSGTTEIVLAPPWTFLAPLAEYHGMSRGFSAEYFRLEIIINYMDIRGQAFTKCHKNSAEYIRREIRIHRTQIRNKMLRNPIKILLNHERARNV